MAALLAAAAAPPPGGLQVRSGQSLIALPEPQPLISPLSAATNLTHHTSWGQGMLQQDRLSEVVHIIAALDSKHCLVWHCKATQARNQHLPARLMHLLLSRVCKACHQGPVQAQSAPTCLPSLLLQLSISPLQLLKHGLL